MNHAFFDGQVLSRLRHVAASLLMLVACGQASATMYQVRLDTSSLASMGSGFLDLQFNPGPGVGSQVAPTATATVGGFAGALVSPLNAIRTGGVSGNLPGVVTFTNTETYNDLFQAVNFGGVFTFTVDFTGSFLSAMSSIGSTFAVSLYDQDGIMALGTSDPGGSLLNFDLRSPGAAGIAVTNFNRSIASALVLTAVPEPDGLLLVLAGLVALGGFATRSGRRLQG